MDMNKDNPPSDCRYCRDQIDCAILPQTFEGFTSLTVRAVDRYHHQEQTPLNKIKAHSFLNQWGLWGGHLLKQSHLLRCLQYLEYHIAGGFMTNITSSYTLSCFICSIFQIISIAGSYDCMDIVL